jgi:6-pyruvoyltetrahydropterin/6-carboxytetrahydropterin synthase
MPFEINFEDPRIGFASAHFIVDHEKCGRLHGHNYFIKVTISGELNEQHMVLDYGILKDELKSLTKPLDHKVLIPENADGLTINKKKESVEIITCDKRYLLPKEDIIIVPLPATTAEELAKYFHSKLKSKWPSYTIKVTIEEAPGASALYTE